MIVQIHISISMRGKNTDTVLKVAMERINQAVEDQSQWKRHKNYDCFQIECDMSEEEIIPIFNKLIAEYPMLDIYAGYSYPIREDDRSAQWWRTIKIETEHHPDGTAALCMDSSTNWF